MQRTLLSLALAAAALSSTAVDAATFCARNAAELRSAFSAAAGNGEADEIRIVRGTHYGSAAAPFYMGYSEPYGLRLSGGWSWLSGSCVLQKRDASNTVLDGAGVVPALRIANTSSFEVVPIHVSNLTFRNGYAGGGANPPEASGLAIGGFAEGEPHIVVDRVIVENNVSTMYPQPAVRLNSDHEHVRFTNSLVRNNVTVDFPTVYVHVNWGGSTLDHLSVLDNARLASGGAFPGVAGTLYLSGSLHLVSHSVFFGNTGGGADIGTLSGTQYRNNFYGSADGPLTPGMGNIAIADPLLDAQARPTAASMLRNTNFWRLSRYDVYGRDRLLGGSSDAGAAEFVE